MTGVNRLAEPRGMLIDRSSVIDFTFENTSYQAYAGDTIASALAAHDRWLLSRSFKYHRPRGVLTMAGQDANALVTVDGDANVSADSTQVRNAMQVFGQNYKGSLDHDRHARLGRFSKFLPVGFYYKTFYKPRGSWEKRWAPMIRKFSGLGRIDPTLEPGYYDKQYKFYDVAVIGGGPAGLRAAQIAGKAGAEVLLIDENMELGGSLNFGRLDVTGSLAMESRSGMVAEVSAMDNVEIMTNAVCNGWFADNWLPIIRDRRLYKTRAKEVILCTGVLEQQAVFRNNDLPGVMMGSAAQRLIRLYGVRPGKRAVVLAGKQRWLRGGA